MYGAMVQVAMNNHTHRQSARKLVVLKFYELGRYNLHPEYINMYSYFCSNGCYNEFANKYIEQVIAIAPRREPLETPIEVEKVHHPEEQYGNDNRYQWTRQAWTETKITEKQ
jgi:hypothetical protein